jgi:tRNA(Ile)-lysidine synthase
MLTLPVPAEDDEDDRLIERMPLTPEEALALFRGALGNDACRGLLLAVSGGPDSIAMMGLAGAIRGFLPPIAVATVDHGLRPEATHEAEAVHEFAREIGISHCTLKWVDRPRGPVSQEQARNGRYALLMGHARAIDATHLVTAHTLDDQAETVLMRMAGGTGTSGLGAMRPNVQRGALIHLRPYLEVPKSRIIATCEKHGWLYAQDPTNVDEHYKRARLRALMPLLAHEGLTAERLGTLAARARRTEDAIEHVAKRNVDDYLVSHARDGGAVRLKADPFLSEPFEIALRMVKRVMLMITDETSREAQIPLGKLEQLLRHLRMAIRDARPFRATLAWAVIAHGSGYVEVRIAPPRRKHDVRAAGRGLATGHAAPK